MTYRTGVVSDFAVYQQQPSRKKASPQAIVGHAALVFVVLACGWTLYSNIAPGGVYAVAAVQPFADMSDVAAAASGTKSSLELQPGNYSNTAAKSDRLPISQPALAKGDRLPIAQPPQQVAELPKAPEAAPASETNPTTASIPLPEARQAALSVPLPTPRPASLRAAPNDGPSRSEATRANKAAVLAAISAPKPSIFERLFGKPQQEKGPTLAFASPDGGITSDGQSLTPGSTGLYDRQTAVYDISARTVYMPDGTKLEAHSGLGDKLDDPRFVHVRMRGATPPHVYDLSLRESLFHGVQAIRLNPVGGEGKVFGRTGLLAHTYMLGPNGDSNGCVSFRNYEAFLRAFRNNEVKRLVVVAKLD